MMKERQTNLFKQNLRPKVDENKVFAKSIQKEMIEKYKNVKNGNKVGNNINVQR